MKHEILIYNKTKRKVSEKFTPLRGVTQRVIISTILKTLDFLKLKQPVEMAVLVVDKEEIKRLNKIWRKKNTTPNELSFGLNSRQIAKVVNDSGSVLELGEIVVNAEKISDKNYLSKILVHSLLHLLGYSHKQMEKFEEKILELCREKISLSV